MWEKFCRKSLYQEEQEGIICIWFKASGNISIAEAPPNCGCQKLRDVFQKASSEVCWTKHLQKNGFWIQVKIYATKVHTTRQALRSCQRGWNSLFCKCFKIKMWKNLFKISFQGFIQIKKNNPRPERNNCRKQNDLYTFGERKVNA